MAALQQCGLPGAWSGVRQWRILETGFGNGLNFLAAWRAWKDDDGRPRLLHYVAIEARPVEACALIQATAENAALAPLSAELSRQWFGLLPGTHRLVFDQGRVMLTVHVNDVREVLRREPFVADSVLLNEDDAELTTLKAVARHCRRGSRITLRTAEHGDAHLQNFSQCGFAIELREGFVDGEFAPPWEPKNPLPADGLAPSHCVVVGAGLAGAAIASSLALRGWRVTVLDEADQPATGASGVPVGLLTPHFSTDDALLSRLSRSGVRATMEQARLLLEEGIDWRACGALEKRAEAIASDVFPPAGMPWSRPAEPSHLHVAGLEDAAAIWHEHAGWIKPAALARAWLAQDGVVCRQRTHVERILRDSNDWVLFGSDGREIERASLVVVAAALNSNAIGACDLPLQPVRGQVSWN
ncbi:MAG: FAD-dependent oxidoreductase, partial [Ramlibacter sp.]|nr:FAD-dependent oxidoreductase [Ramlibacter sp.]